eukprot:3453939-Amphidinium_carterae.1
MLTVTVTTKRLPQDQPGGWLIAVWIQMATSIFMCLLWSGNKHVYVPRAFSRKAPASPGLSEHGAKTVEDAPRNCRHELLVANS